MALVALIAVGCGKPQERASGAPPGPSTPAASSSELGSSSPTIPGIPSTGPIRLRDLVGRLHGVVLWESKTKTVTAYVDKVRIELRVGGNSVKVGDKVMKISLLPYIQNGRTMIDAGLYGGALALAGKTAAPAAAPDAGSAWDQIRAARSAVKSYKVTMQQGAQKITQYVKMKDGKPSRMRMETGQAWVLVQIDTKSVFLYNPQQKVAMKTTTDKGAMADQSTLDDIEMIQKGNPKVTSDKLDGADCWIVSMTAKNQATVWIDKKQGLIRQLKQKNITVKLKVEDVNAVADSQFELPADTKVQDMSETGKNIKPQ